MKQKLIFTNLVGEAIDGLIAELGNPQVAVVADTNTAALVLPILVNDSKAVADATVITIPAGDGSKSIEGLSELWQKLSDMEASRSTVVVNLGGGMIGDLGGFAAATYKRGLRCINVPTTLLAAVDASVGGKTAINFNGLKNQIGTFTEPVAAIISTIYFNTLSDQEILSGYAEMIKHALLEDDATLGKVLAFNPVSPLKNTVGLMPLLEASVDVKRRIVEEDLTEKGIRKALNFGHTIGHAFESFAAAAKSPIPHGYAVAWGMVAELVLSQMKKGFPSATLHSVAAYVRDNYGAFPITCDDYPALIASMRQDKKNASAEQINFTLLESTGHPVIDCTATPEEIGAALDIYRDLLGLA
ncbi:MAG: 3-dehydroquinate synthase [Muribaculaceae bacterium]|nr:3-dehydroquinate synthase [Muribaculaceae bacterium]